MCATSAVIRAFKKVETFNVCMYSVPLILVYHFPLAQTASINNDELADHDITDKVCVQCLLPCI